MTDLPNIVYLNSHDTGRYIGPYGYDIDTPHLRALAEEGVLFRHCHAAAPTCSPSRAALMTGEYPHKNGMFGLAHRGHRLVDYDRTLAALLRGRGYRTAAWGMPANHCLRLPDPRETAATMGYEEWLGHDEAAAEKWLTGHGGKPFFLSMSWGLTHRGGPRGAHGFSTEPDHGRYDPRYCLPPEPLPDTAACREDWAWFCSDATALDRRMGAVIEAIDAAGLTDSTLIVATTDHGVPFPGMKCSLTRHGTGVFLIVRGPGGFEGGQVVDHLVSHVDVWPTVAGLVGADIPDRLDGHDLRDCLGEQGRPIHDELYGEVTYHASYEPKRSLRTDRWLYTRRFGDRRQPVLSNCDRSLSKDVWMAAGWPARVEADEALFDTCFDPQERHNLAADPRYAHVLAEYRARLEAWMRRTSDPLLCGPVPLPDGGIDTIVDETDPKAARIATAGVPEHRRLQAEK